MKRGSGGNGREKERRVEYILSDVYARRLSGLRTSCFNWHGDIGVSEFVNNVDKPAFLKRKLVRSDVHRYKLLRV